MRPLLPLLFLILSGIPSSGEDSRPRLGTDVNLNASLIPLFAGDPSRRDQDAVTYLGGVRLRSKDPAFGGFSSMTLVGDRFTLLSDSGNIVSFRMGADFRPSEVRFGDLRDGPGPGYGWSKPSRDSESMTRDPATGRIWVGFENANQIWRYDPGLTRAEAWSGPALMRRWDVNGGAESLVRLRDGSFIAISETTRLADGKGYAGVRFSGDPVTPGTRSFSFGFRAPEGGFQASDITQLPDGRLLVLVRRISINRWFESKLVLLDPRAIRPGASLAGRELAAFTIPTTRDNFEALSATEENGRTILWIASDDNRELVQQSLLMKFRLNLAR